MARGLLLQPELVMTWIKKDQDDSRFIGLKNFIERPEDPGDFVALSSISYGITYSSIVSAGNLSPEQAETLKGALRNFRRSLNDDAYFYDFDVDAAGEWADVRFHCRTLSTPMSGETQMEYAIARANQLGVLAPAQERKKYPALTSLIVTYL